MPITAGQREVSTPPGALKVSVLDEMTPTDTPKIEADMKLSFLLMCLAGLLGATTMNWSQLWDRRSLTQLHHDVRVGMLRVGLYTMIVAPVSVALLVAGLYLALTWR